MSSYLVSVGSIAPRRFGIDEFYLQGKQLCVMTDLRFLLQLVFRLVFHQEQASFFFDPAQRADSARDLSAEMSDAVFSSTPSSSSAIDIMSRIDPLRPVSRSMFSRSSAG